MLTQVERDRLKNSRDLSPMERAKLYFRVAQKIKTKLSEIDEITEALCALPDKNAKRALGDDMIAAIFTLTEKMLEKLGYQSIKIDYMGAAYVAKAEPPRKSKDGKSKTIEVKMELASRQDMARHALVNDHLDVLNHLVKDPPFGLPISEVPDCILDHITCNDPADVVAARQMLTKWGRPGVRTFEKFGDRLEG